MISQLRSLLTPCTARQPFAVLVLLFDFRVVTVPLRILSLATSLERRQVTFYNVATFLMLRDDLNFFAHCDGWLNLHLFLNFACSLFDLEEFEIP